MLYYKNKFISFPILLTLFITFVSATFVHSLSLPQGEIKEKNQTTIPHSNRLIVELHAPPLIEWAINQEGSLSELAKERYLIQLQSEQNELLDTLENNFPYLSLSQFINENGMKVDNQYQLLFNGFALEIGSSAVQLEETRRQLASLPEVKAVHLDYAHEPLLFNSLPHINSAALWDQVGGFSTAGAGILFATMDAGIHHDAPMFSGTGFSYPVGWPTDGLGDTANNNGKIVASRAYFRSSDPPLANNGDSWPGPESSSHGVHTAAIATGNPVTATFSGSSIPISGIAPAAWVMSYRVFYPSVGNLNSFFTAEGISALEDIVADGADVLLNSWGNGPQPGGEFDPLDAALINATRANIFVTMATGNSGPHKGTTAHPSSEYINVAATTKSQEYSTGLLSITAPEPISSSLQNLPFGTASFGSLLNDAPQLTYTYKTAPSVDPANPFGCSPFPANSFDGKAALISRGGCVFADKTYYAQEAGALLTIIYNNDPGGAIDISCGGTHCADITIPTIVLSEEAGTAVASWFDNYGNDALIDIDFLVNTTPDIVAQFSSRGPSFGNELKPDIAAPGVAILSQGYGPGTDETVHFGYSQQNGTSMAAPHVAGAAILLRQKFPSWSNEQIKSAMMSSATYKDVWNGDGSPAQPLDIGAGRLDLTNVTDPGLILSPPSLSFGLTTQGIGSTAQFEITNIYTATEQYTLSTLFTGNGFYITQTTTLTGFSLSPTEITLAPNESATIFVTFDGIGSGIGDNQGYIILQGTTHEVHLPLWGRVLPPPTADILLIDADFSPFFSFADYSWYYQNSLDTLGLSYDYWDGVLYNGNSSWIPDTATLQSYETVIVFTGDNYYPDGTFTTATILTKEDMAKLVEYGNNGGKLIIMGQDALFVLNNAYLQTMVGATLHQDNLNSSNLPDQRSVALPSAPPAYQTVQLDMYSSFWNLVTLDGANEVPPVSSDHTGTANFWLDINSGNFWYNITVTPQYTTTLTGIHIHNAPILANGPVVHPLLTTATIITDVWTLNGMVTLSQSEQTALWNNELYLNIHTSAHTSGELRAQITPENSWYRDSGMNQYYIDEIESWPNQEPNSPNIYPYQPLLYYPGGTHIQDGTIMVRSRYQPSLEQRSIPSPQRTIFSSFGLEGVNNMPDSTNRAELLELLLNSLNDEPTLGVTDITTDNPLEKTLSATMNSNIGATGWQYRWDWGDGSPILSADTTNPINHTYADCGIYIISVEGHDNFGNVVVNSYQLPVFCPPVFVPFLTHR